MTTKKFTLSSYQVEMLKSLTNEESLNTALRTFINNPQQLPFRLDDSPRKPYPLKLNKDDINILTEIDGVVSKALRKMMNVRFKNKPSDSYIKISQSQYDALMLLGNGNVGEGLKTLVGP